MGLVPSDSTRAFQERTSRLYHDQLNGDAVAYLTDRGITKDIAEEFLIGLVADPAPGHEKYKGCISIPYLTPSGSCVSIRFRNLSGEGPKYMTQSGDQPRIFNTKALETGFSAICLCEGEFDAMIASSVGLPTIGIPGVNSWQDRWYRLVAHYSAVFILSDDDDPGQELPKKLGKKLSNIRNVPMTGGDVNSYYLEHGPEALKAKVGAK